MEGNNGPATQANAANWAQQFGQTGVVVADGNFNSGQHWYPFGTPAGGNNWNINLPGIILLDEGMEIATMSQPTQSQIEAALNN